MQWHCAVCYAPVLDERPEGQHEWTPASRYWSPQMNRVYCGPEHALLDMTGTLCDNPQSDMGDV